AAVAADKDEIAALFFGGLNKAICHIEVGNRLAFGLDACGFGAVEHGLQILLSLFLSSFVVVFVGNGVGGGHAIKTDRCSERLGDIKRNDFRTGFASKTYPFVGRLCRQRRPVGWNKNFFEHCSSPHKVALPPKINCKVYKKISSEYTVANYSITVADLDQETWHLVQQSYLAGQRRLDSRLFGGLIKVGASRACTTIGQHRGGQRVEQLGKARHIVGRHGAADDRLIFDTQPSLPRGRHDISRQWLIRPAL